MSSQESERQAESQDAVVSSTVPECAVCLQVCIHPARLPCNHIFCYLCVKGVANQSKRCPMCRQEIPADYLERPQLLELDQQKETAAAEEESSEEAYQWFYEGRNGWWQYDQRTSLELETAYKQGKRSCELLIAGFLYIADFGTMLQLRRNDHSRRRRIKRDLSNAPKKGVAGLRLNNTPAQEQEEMQQQLMLTREIRGAERPESPVDDPIGERSDGWPITPSNTPHETLASSTTSTSSEPINWQRDPGNNHDSLHEVIGQMRSLMLRDQQHLVAEDPGLRTTLESLVAREQEEEEEDAAEGDERRQQ